MGLISRQVGLFEKFSLWSFSVMNASLLAVASTLSSIPSFVVIFLFSVWMFLMVSSCDICSSGSLCFDGSSL